MMVITLLRQSAKIRFAATLIALALAGCAAEQGMIPHPLYKSSDTATGNGANLNAETSKTDFSVTMPPVPPAPTRLSTIKKPKAEAGKEEVADISLSFDQIPLPSFIQVTFGSILKKNYNVDAQVATRTDLITLRTSAAQTPSQVLATATTLLKTYGVAVTELGGFYRIGPDKDQSAYAPEIRRGRAQPDVPLPLRPVYNLVELTAVRTPDIVALLKTLFGTKLNVQDVAITNSILISGQSSDVTAALEAIQVLDQPMMRGRMSRRIVPNSLSVDELSKKLIDILSAEGYAVSSSLSVGTSPIVLIPAPTSNSLLAFAADQAILNHIVDWSRQLDADGNNGRHSGNFFTYPVKYGDAQNLAKTMQDILSSSASASNVASTTPGTAAPVHAPSKIVVDPTSNTLIFISSQEQYLQLLDILKELDQPSKSALIEVTVAEVTVNDQNSLGVQWALNGASSNTSTTGATTGVTSAGASANFGSTTGGVLVNYLSGRGKVAATISALSQVAKTKVLSTPRIMARNGETASIEVGAQVPIITSQISNANTQTAGATGANAGILQTVQYLPTGVILRVRPIIHSGNRVELDVSQEVSQAAPTQTGVNTSPTITTRKVDTKLSIRDGTTVLLGGMMQSSDTKSNSGIPFLKDIPGIGPLFGSVSDTVEKTELIVLITPYIIDDDNVAEQVTDAFRDQLGPWAQTAPGESPSPKVARTPVAIPAQRQNQVQAPASAPELAPSVVPATMEPEVEVEEAQPVNVSQPSVPPPVPTGTKVTDPHLLDELKKAAGANPK